jgi:hypothetical protein
MLSFIRVALYGALEMSQAVAPRSLPVGRAQAGALRKPVRIEAMLAAWSLTCI